MLFFDKNIFLNKVEKSKWNIYVKKTITIRATLVSQNGFVDTLEGKLKFVKGNYICIGVVGEVYPYEKKHFEEKYERVEQLYSDVDDKINEIKLITDVEKIYAKEDVINSWNVYKTKYMPIIAAKIEEPFRLDSVWGVQNGKAGDYIICQNENLYYICDQNVFLISYYQCIDSKKLLEI